MRKFNLLIYNYLALPLIKSIFFELFLSIYQETSMHFIHTVSECLYVCVCVGQQKVIIKHFFFIHEMSSNLLFHIIFYQSHFHHT